MSPNEPSHSVFLTDTIKTILSWSTHWIVMQYSDTHTTLYRISCICANSMHLIPAKCDQSIYINIHVELSEF